MGCIQRKQHDCISITNYSPISKINYQTINSLIELKPTPFLINSFIESKYNTIEEIGKGSFGVVYLIKELHSNIYRTMKVINKINHYENQTAFKQRIDHVMSFDHPNILKVYEYYMDERNYYVISEYIPGVELSSLLDTVDHLSEDNVKEIVRQLLAGLNYLHLNKMIHRDIKLQNILIDKPIELSKKDIKKYTIKLIDFDSSCKQINDSLECEKIGSPLYMAPEILTKSYNEKCDIWAAGIILHYLLVGYPPFNGRTKDELFSNIKEGKLSIDLDNWKHISQEAKSLLKQMLQISYNKRPSASECLQHPWLKKKDDNFDKIVKALKNIVLFDENKLCKMKQITIAYIIYAVNSDDQFNELKSVFEELDKTKIGLLSYNDIVNAFKALTVNYISHQIEYDERKIIRNLSSVDSNHDCMITYEEFLFLTIDYEKLMTYDNVLIAFNYFDNNKDGVINSSDLKRIFGSIPSDIKEWLGKDRNAQLNFHDFYSKLGTKNAISQTKQKKTIIYY